MTVEEGTETNLEENSAEAPVVEQVEEKVNEVEQAVVEPSEDELTAEALSEKIVNELTSTREKYTALQDKHQALLSKIDRLIFGGGASITSDDLKSESESKTSSRNNSSNLVEGIPEIPSLEGFKGKLF